MSTKNKLSCDLKFLHVPAGAQHLEMQIRGFTQHHQAWVDSMDTVVCIDESETEMS